MPETRPPAAKPCPIRVIVREGSGERTIIHDKSGDHNDRFFRDWIANTTWWAMRNGKTVTQYPEEP